MGYTSRLKAREIELAKLLGQIEAPSLRKERDGLRSSVLDFQLNGLIVRSAIGSMAMSTEIGWTPIVHLSGSFGLRGDLSAFSLRVLGASQVVFGFEEAALLSWLISPQWMLEGGGGVQSWTQGYGPAGFMATGNLAFMLDPSDFGIFDRIFVGGSSYSNVIQFKAGIGIQF